MRTRASDLLRKATDKWNELQVFLLTRDFVFADVAFLSEGSDVELRELRLLPPWRFNVTQSALCGLIGVTLGYFVTGGEQASDAGSHPYLTRLLSSAIAITVPFTTLLWAKVAAWSSVRRGDREPNKVTKAKRAFLYMDGAYGFAPQALISFCSVMMASSIDADRLLAQTAGGCAGVYELALFFFLFPSALFAINGYSEKVVWVRQLWNRKMLFGPSYKYALTQFAVMMIYLVVGVMVLLATVRLKKP